MRSRFVVLFGVLALWAAGCAAEVVSDAGLDAARDQGRDGLGDGSVDVHPWSESGIDTLPHDSLPPDALPPDVLPPDTLSPDVGVPKHLGCGVETLAGSATPGTYDGYRQLARFNNPVNIGALPGGDLLVSDFDNNRVRRITPDGLVTTLALLQRPFGLNVAPDGTVYVQTDHPASGAATNEGAIWKVDPLTGVATVVLDKCGRVRGFAVMPDGRLVLADLDQSTISLFDPVTKTTSPIAGLSGTPGFADGTGGQARFSFPYDILVENQGSVLVADMANGRLRRVTIPGGVVTTFAGSGALGSTDGPLLQASFNQPKGLAFGPRGEIYVSESGGRVVRRIENGEVKTIAGTGVPGYKDDNDPLKAQFYAIEGITVGANQKYLYLADGNQGDGTGHHRVRRIGIPPCTPPTDGGVPDASGDRGVDGAPLDSGVDGAPLDSGVDGAPLDSGVDGAPGDAQADAPFVDAATDAGVGEDSAFSDASSDAKSENGGSGT